MPPPGIAWIKNLNLGAVAEAQLSGVARRARASNILRKKIASWDPEDVASAAQSVRMHLFKGGEFGQEGIIEAAIYHARSAFGAEASLDPGLLQRTGLGYLKNHKSKAQLEALSFLKTAEQAQAAQASGSAWYRYSPDKNIQQFMTEAYQRSDRLSSLLYESGGGVSWGQRATAVSPEMVTRNRLWQMGSSVGSESENTFRVVAHEYAERVSSKINAAWRIPSAHPQGNLPLGHQSRLPIWAEYKASARVGKEFLNESIESRVRGTADQLRHGLEALAALPSEGRGANLFYRRQAGASAAQEVFTMSRRILRKTDPQRLARLQSEGLFALPTIRQEGDLLRRLGARPSEIKAHSSLALERLEADVKSVMGRQSRALHTEEVQRLDRLRDMGQDMLSGAPRGSHARTSHAQVLRSARRHVQATSQQGRRNAVQSLFEHENLTYAPRTSFAPGMPQYGSGHGGLVRELGKRGRRSKVISQRSRSSLVGTPAPEIAPRMHRNQGNRLSRGGGGMA